MAGRPRLFTNDSTIEAVALLSAANRKGILLSRDELSAWLANFERRGGNDRGFWIECYGGRPYTIDRVKNARPVHVEHLSVSICGAAQPDPLQEFLLNGGDDGLASRFMYFFPRAKRFLRPQSVADQDWALAAFRRLNALQPDIDQVDGKAKPRVVPFTREAEDLLVTWRQQHEARVSAGKFASWLGKCPGLVVRLTLVIEYLAWSEQDGRADTAVSGGVAATDRGAIPPAIAA
ncbi:MAG: DUF3987 domain-containing protein [Alphaproteobacteria bacterium]|nr:DUF3987 domain-containing protein [Alphaproteobacteria bacterium]